LNEELGLAAPGAVDSTGDLPNQAEFNHKQNWVSRISATEFPQLVVLAHSVEKPHTSNEMHAVWPPVLRGKSNIISSDGSYQETIGGTKGVRGETMPDTNLSRRAGFFPSLGLIAVPAVVVAGSAIVVAVSAIVITVTAFINLSGIVTTHSRFEMPDTFAKPFGDLRDATRTEQDDYYHSYHQQLGHS
jgi:hypothetical protein